MTDEAITVREVDGIKRGDATRPWGLNETTVNEMSRMNGLARRIDTIFVPWAAQEPVDQAELLFTVEMNVLERRERSLEDFVAEVVEFVESDPRLDEYIVFEHLTPEAEYAPLDDMRARVRVEWKARSE